MAVGSGVTVGVAEGVAVNAGLEVSVGMGVGVGASGRDSMLLQARLAEARTAAASSHRTLFLICFSLVPPNRKRPAAAKTLPTQNGTVTLETASTDWPRESSV